MMMTGWFIRTAIWMLILSAAITLFMPLMSIPTPEISFIRSAPQQNGIAIMDVTRGVIADYIRESLIGRQTDLTWSPDSTIIVFRAVQNITIDLYAVDIRTKQIRKLTGTGKNNHAPSFSPDGRWIAFTSERDGNPEIYVTSSACLYGEAEARCKDSDTHRLTNNTVADDQAAWSPDSQQIVFQSNRDGDFEIYRMNRDGSDQIRLTNSPQRDFQPDWSPDGRKIVFVSERDINDELYSMNIDGSNQQRLTMTPEFEFTPLWSRDGKQILFQRTVPGSDYETWVMDADGTHVQRLTTISMFLQNPAWR